MATNGLLTGADGSNYVTPTLYEATATPTATTSYSAVDSGDIHGAYVAIADDTTSSTQFVGYKGGERYVCVKLEETSTSVSAGIWSIHVILSRPYEAPADTAPTTGTVT